MSHNLKVVGAGHLGVRVAHLWKQKVPEAQVYLTTRLYDPYRSSKWITLGFEVSSRQEEEIVPIEPVKVPYVVFCAPPRNNRNYANVIKTSIQTDRDTSSPHGAFLFTSSSGVYSENSGGLVDEESPVASHVERYAMLLQGEKHVLASKGGVVLRFAGLYSKTRGPHSFWLGRSENLTSNARPNGLFNLVHYDDAAQCVVDTLLKSHLLSEGERVLLVSDGVPISRTNICHAALKCPVYADKEVPDFQGDDEVEGRRCDTTLVRTVIGWKPRFKSFAEFMEKASEDETDIQMFGLG